MSKQLSGIQCIQQVFNFRVNFTLKSSFFRYVIAVVAIVLSVKLSSYFEEAALWEDDNGYRVMTFFDFHCDSSQEAYKELNKVFKPNDFRIQDIQNVGGGKQVSDLLQAAQDLGALMLVEDACVYYLKQKTLESKKKFCSELNTRNLGSHLRFLIPGCAQRNIYSRSVDIRWPLRFDRTTKVEILSEQVCKLVNLYKKTVKKVERYKTSDPSSLHNVYATFLSSLDADSSESTTENKFLRRIISWYKKRKDPGEPDCKEFTQSLIDRTPGSSEKKRALRFNSLLSCEIPAYWVDIKILHTICKHRRSFKDIFVCAGSWHCENIEEPLKLLGYSCKKRISSIYDMHDIEKYFFLPLYDSQKASQQFALSHICKQTRSKKKPNRYGASFNIKKFMPPMQRNTVGHKRKRADEDQRHEDEPPQKKRKI